MGEEQVTDLRTLSEPVVIATLATTLLTLDDGVDEACHHVEFSPVDLRRIVVVIVWVSFVSANEIRKVNLPAERRQSKNLSKFQQELTMRVYMRPWCSAAPSDTSDVSARIARADPIVGSSSSARLTSFAVARATRLPQTLHC